MDQERFGRFIGELDYALMTVRHIIRELDFELPTWNAEYTTGVNREATAWLERMIATFERRAAQSGGPLDPDKE